MGAVKKMSAAQARRIAVAATGLDGALPGARRRVGPVTLTRAISRLGLLQLDSVNVFERSHYLLLFARLGSYERGSLDAMLRHTGHPRLGAYTEYWAHEAAVIAADDWPLWHWKRQSPMRPKSEAWAAEHASLIDEVRAEFAERGVIRASELEHPANERTRGGWWNKSEAYWATTVLFTRGELVTVARSRFERLYGVAEHVLPPEALRQIPRGEAQLELVRRAAIAHGIATLDDLADYYRLKLGDTKTAVEALADAGELLPVEVEGWGRAAWMHAGAKAPRRVRATALLSPFDPLVWHRPRAQRIFDFTYRISIYTPAAERTHGYYVLPVLIDDEIVGRIDLKSDRRHGVLRVQVATIEPQFAARAGQLADRLAPALAEAADWQGLDRIEVTRAGTWSSEVASAMRTLG